MRQETWEKPRPRWGQPQLLQSFKLAIALNKVIICAELGVWFPQSEVPEFTRHRYWRLEIHPSNQAWSGAWNCLALIPLFFFSDNVIKFQKKNIKSKITESGKIWEGKNGGKLKSNRKKHNKYIKQITSEFFQ